MAQTLTLNGSRDPLDELSAGVMTTLGGKMDE